MAQLEYNTLKNMTMGEKLHTLRKANGYTQIYVAKEIGITKSLVSMYEADKRVPSRSTLLKLAQIYSVSMDFLMGRDRGFVEKSTLTDNGCSCAESAEQDFKYLPAIPMYNTPDDYKNSNSCGYASEDDLLINYNNEDLFFIKMGGKVASWALCEPLKNDFNTKKNYIMNLSGALVIVSGKDVPPKDRVNIIGMLKIIITLY